MMKNSMRRQPRSLPKIMIQSLSSYKQNSTMGPATPKPSQTKNGADKELNAYPLPSPLTTHHDVIPGALLTCSGVSSIVLSTVTVAAAAVLLLWRLHSFGMAAGNCHVAFICQTPRGIHVSKDHVRRQTGEIMPDRRKSHVCNLWSADFDIVVISLLLKVDL